MNSEERMFSIPGLYKTIPAQKGQAANPLGMTACPFSISLSCGGPGLRMADIKIEYLPAYVLKKAESCAIM